MRALRRAVKTTGADREFHVNNAIGKNAFYSAPQCIANAVLAMAIQSVCPLSCQRMLAFLSYISID